MELSNKKVIFLFFLVGIVLLAIGGVIYASNQSSSENNQDNNIEEDGGDLTDAEDYIENSKKAAFTDTMFGYIQSTINEVNLADKLKFFDTTVLYLVPVGEGKCIEMAKGGTSPYSDTWEYLYVGVTYSGSGYDYYIVGLDSSGKGIDFTPIDVLYDKNQQIVKEKEKLLVMDFKELYNSTDNRKYAFEASEDVQSFFDVAGLREIANISMKDEILVVSSCEN